MDEVTFPWEDSTVKEMGQQISFRLFLRIKLGKAENVYKKLAMTHDIF